MVAGKNLGLALTGNALGTDNYRVNNALHQLNLKEILRYRFATGPRALLKFGVDDQKLGLPATRTEAQLQTDRRGTATPRDYTTRDGAFVTLRGEHSNRLGDFAADFSFVTTTVRRYSTITVSISLTPKHSSIRGRTCGCSIRG